MRTPRPAAALIPLLLGIVLLTSACEAPLKPESQQAGTPAPALKPASPSKSTGTPKTLRTPSRKASRPSPAAPSLTVPSLSIPPRTSGLVEGADASWPQCPKGMGIPQKPTQGSPMPLATARFVILGLTNGPAFTPNPCLADQVDWVRSRGLLAAAYAVNSYPDSQTIARYGDQGPYDGGSRAGALSNVGYQQAQFNLATMKAAGLQTPVIWLDVEPVPNFAWSSETTANSAVVRGAARGYTDKGFRIGVYSTQTLWTQVVGDLRLGLPEWLAAGQTSRAEALRRCGPDRMFQGGEPVLSQWVEFGRDRNITCPGTSSQMTRWFHQY